MDRKIIGMKAVNKVNFETPITEDEWIDFHSHLVDKIDEIIGSLSYTKGYGHCVPIYEGEDE